MPRIPFVWRLLRSYLRDRQWTRFARDSSEPLPSWYVLVAEMSHHILTEVVCGPPKYSEIRINIAQAFNGIGTVVAPVLGSYVFFNHVGTDQASLENVQWTYLGIACFVFALAILYYFTEIPEITGRLLHGSDVKSR
jgi:hypothetical protein